MTHDEDRYGDTDAPESGERSGSKSWDYTILAVLVVVIVVLLATGVVPLFGF